MPPARAYALFLVSLPLMSCMGEPPASPPAASGEGLGKPSAAEPVLDLHSIGTPSTARVEHRIVIDSEQATATITSTTDKVDNPTGDAGAESERTSEDAGSWTSVCQRLSDCGCNPMPSTQACARTAETSYTQGMALARSMGTPESMLAMMEMSEERMATATASPCEAVCQEVNGMLHTLGEMAPHYSDGQGG